MASSRRSARDADPVAAALVRALRNACEAAGPSARPPVFIVAWSGGLDSTVLVHAAAAVPVAVALVAVHVNHGLQSAAHAWPSHCEREAARMGVRCEIHRVQGSPPPGASIEAWARERRYEALASAATHHGALGVLTAHHADDQAETLLMRIARGSGVDGLAGIVAHGRRGDLLLLRPLLGLRRVQLASYARRHGLQWVEDPSNQDESHLRNAMRHRVLPVLDAVAPAFRGKLVRLGTRLGEAREAIAALADIDLDRATLEKADLQGGAQALGIESGPSKVDAPALDSQALFCLSEPRRCAALRLWLSRLGVRPPSEAKLREIERQLVLSRSAYGLVAHEGLLLRRHRRRIEAVRAESAVGAVSPEPIVLAWQGERSLAVPGFGGELRFDESGSCEGTGCVGVSADWLRGRALRVRSASAVLRLRAHPEGRTRTLKNLYQERGIPAWLRASLPLVETGGRVLLAAGLGMDQSRDWPRTGVLVRLRWTGHCV